MDYTARHRPRADLPILNTSDKPLPGLRARFHPGTSPGASLEHRDRGFTRGSIRAPHPDASLSHLNASPRMREKQIS